MLNTTQDRLSWRFLLLGICFVIAICCIVSYAELVLTYIQIGFLQLPPAVIGLFFFRINTSNGSDEIYTRVMIT